MLLIIKNRPRMVPMKAIAWLAVIIAATLVIVMCVGNARDWADRQSKAQAKLSVYDQMLKDFPTAAGKK